jgi:hypothetical protein
LVLAGNEENYVSKNFQYIFFIILYVWAHGPVSRLRRS